MFRITRNLLLAVTLAFLGMSPGLIQPHASTMATPLETLDQSQTVANNVSSFAGSGNWLGQTFTAGLSGDLVRVSMELEWHTQSSSDIAVSIRPVGGDGYPTATVVGSATIPNSAVPAAGSPGWVDVPITGTRVTAGAQYAILLSINSGRVSWWENSAGGYSGGNEVELYSGGGTGSSSADATFETYVAPVTACANGGTAVTDMTGLQDLNNHLSVGDKFCLAYGLDASGYSFSPIGQSDPFGGTLDGQNLTISHLTITSSKSSTGLFADLSGTVMNLSLVDAHVSGGSGTGALAGETEAGASVTSISVTGTVTGGGDIGGLVGDNGGSITASHSTAAVNAPSHVDVGGLVGDSWGSISESYSTGAVSGDDTTGGLVGVVDSTGSITSSYSTGAVSGNRRIGGLAGENDGSITSSHSTGSVTGSSDYIGGLVGLNDGGDVGTITSSYSTGAVSGANDTGGLVGENDYGSITDSYSTGSVSGATETGGLLGGNWANSDHTKHASISHSYSTGSVSGADDSGGLVGLNDAACTITDSYWRTDNNVGLDGVAANAGTDGSQGLTDTAMRQKDSFSGFDFASTWGMDDGATYPYLKGQAPVITGHTPTGTGVATGTNVTVTFNEAMDDSSFSSNSFYLMAGGNKVAAGLSWDSGTNTETLNPTDDLTSGTTYTVTVVSGGSGVKDAAGKALPADGVWSFTTTGTPVCSNGGTAITDMDGLQAIKDNLSGTYCLAANLDATNYSFTPIGTSGTPFTGTFDGQGHTISNLTINLPSANSVGLIAYLGAAGKVMNIGMVAESVSGANETGGLVGTNYGSIDSSYSNGTVTGNLYVGGLVGQNYATITNSHSTGAVTGSGDSTGGLVGINGSQDNSSASITDSYSTGTVTEEASEGGGLVGTNYGSIDSSYSTGTVTGSHEGIGGLAGENYSSGSITSSYSTGDVSSSSNAGGLVGSNFGSVTSSYSTGDVSGALAGGLAGTNMSVETIPGSISPGSITSSYSTGNVTGAVSGGLVAMNVGSITSSYSSGTVTATGDSPTTGGLVAMNGTSVYPSATIASSYWDTTNNQGLTGVGANYGTDGSKDLTDTEMRQKLSFTGFDFAATWGIGDGATYPYLQWQAPVITGHTPTGTDVATDTKVTVTFNKAMRGSTISSSKFYLTPQGGTALSITPSISFDRKTATLNAYGLAISTTYTVTVKGGSSGVLDQAGQALPADAKWSFTTATPPPCPTITISPDSLPAATQNVYYSQALTASGGKSGTYAWSWVADSGSTLPDSLNIDSETGEIYGTPITADVGSHSFTVTASDGACSGNRDYTLTVNAAPTFLTVPGTPGLAGGFSTPNQGSFDLTWTASAGGSGAITYELQHSSNGGSTWNDVSGATALTGNTYSFGSGGTSQEGTGAWIYRVRARAGSETTSWSPGSTAIVVDRTKPNAPSITSPANNSYNTTGIVTVTGTAEKGSTVTLYDGATPVGDPATADAGTGVWSITLSGVPDGSHVYKATATDAAGNVSGFSATRTVIVQTTAPAKPIITSPVENAVLTSTSVTVAGTAVPNSVVRIFAGSVSKATVTANGSGAWSKAITGLSDGLHTLTATATSPAGKTSDPSDPVHVTVDTIHPTITFRSPDNGATGVATDTNVVVTFSEPMKQSTSSDATVYLTVAGSNSHLLLSYGWDGAGTTLTLDPNPDLISGTKYTVTVKSVTDLAGNPLATNSSWSFTTGPVPLGAPGKPVADDPISQGTFTLTWSPSSGGGGPITYTLQHSNNNGSTWSTVDSGISSTSYAFAGTQEGEGKWIYQVQATDGTQTSAWSTHSSNVIVDRTAPTVTITTPATTTAYVLNASVNAKFSCTDPLAGIQSCTALADGATTVANGKPFPTSPIGPHTFTVTATDKAGNSVTTDPITYTVGYKIAYGYNTGTAFSTTGLITLSVQLLDANNVNKSADPTVAGGIGLLAKDWAIGGTVTSLCTPTCPQFTYVSSLGGTGSLAGPGYRFTLPANPGVAGNYLLHFTAFQTPDGVTQSEYTAPVYQAPFLIK